MAAQSRKRLKRKEICRGFCAKRIIGNGSDAHCTGSGWEQAGNCRSRVKTLGAVPHTCLLSPAQTDRGQANVKIWLQGKPVPRMLISSCNVVSTETANR